ncbi:Zn-ribbon domain-containing OB-fold protein [Actinomadura atramentaria]|uniref:Zn-ribbon domain-containing OB-fold protein n=1 Tax=Actinomadura atramentaria TaxID=1990 RepID=UPI00037A6582|nr:OB-fold domain-containing protein [Actinomadura atramentaria]
MTNGAKKRRTPAIDGWFAPEPGGGVRLLGTRCAACGTPYFPRNDLACRNPRCDGPRDGSELAEHRLSDRGRIWSYADARYKPPPPFVADEPFRPFAVAAVELAAERMIVLGRVVPGVTVDDLAVGMEMALTEGVLYEDDDTEYTVWMWQPA